MFINTEAEVSHLGEVATIQLVLLHLQALFQDFLGLLAAHSAEARDLLVSSDTERTNSVSSLKPQKQQQLNINLDYKITNVSVHFIS